MDQTNNRFYREPANTNDGGPAFPVTRDDVAKNDAWGGMTLRDYFAAKAMAGICAHPDTWGLDAEQIAKYAYINADAMLRARGEA